MLSNNDPWREFSQLRGFVGAKYSIFDHPAGYVEGRTAAALAAGLIMIPVGICYGIYEGAKWVITHVPNELTALPIGAALASTVAFSNRIAWPRSARITTAVASTIIATGLTSVMRIPEGSLPETIAAHPVITLDFFATAFIGMGAYFHPEKMARNKIKTAAVATAVALTTLGASGLKYINNLR